jgi:O-6-methylguanine DNA methyltransferase
MKKQEKLQLFYSFFGTPLGYMCAIVDEKSLYFLQFVDNLEEIKKEIKNFGIMAYATISEGTTPITELTIKEINQYFTQKLEKFSIPLVLCGTPFQVKIWLYLGDIPYGYLTCYTKFAEDVLGDKKLTRAAATAIGKNNILIIIPCHRITTTTYRTVQNEKTRGNYKGGPRRKELILIHERFMQEQSDLLKLKTGNNEEYFA